MNLFDLFDTEDEIMVSEKVNMLFNSAIIFRREK